MGVEPTDGKPIGSGGDGTTASPPPPLNTLATTVATSDPGDDTQRNFRYQHAYGVILLIAAATGSRPYVAVYCEHHEDLLAERTDQRYDAHQVKTRKPEDGAWQLNDEDFEKAIRRFVMLDERFPGQVTKFYFVSNAAFLDTVTSDRPHRSPIKLLAAVASASDASELSGRTAEAFEALRAACDHDGVKCGDAALWSVLTRLELVLAPSRDEIFGVVAHDHLPRLPACASLTAARLNGLRDELIDLVLRAASRGREDPSRHYLPLGPERDGGRIRAKRIAVDDLLARVTEGTAPSVPPFRYTVAPERLSGAPAAKSQLVLEKKLARAGLHGQVDLLHRRALVAEPVSRPVFWTREFVMRPSAPR